MPRRYDWFFKEVFLILSAPIFWAVLTNFGRVWRFIDDRYYHKEAKQYRKDKRDAKRLHFELTGHYEYYHYHLSDRAEDFCAAFLKKLGCCKDKLKKRKKKRQRKKNNNNNNNNKSCFSSCCTTRSRQKQTTPFKTKKSFNKDRDDLNDNEFTGITMNTIENKIFDAKKHNDETDSENKEDIDNNAVHSPSSVDNDNNNDNNNNNVNNNEELGIGTSDDNKDNDNKFKTPLKKLRPSAIRTSPSDEIRSESPGDEKWKTIGKHAVLRSRLRPTSTHAFDSKTEPTHNITYSKHFIHNDDDY